MDVASWLWERVERRDAPAVLAHALSLAPTRDDILRRAAISGQWDQLAVAAAEAADVARHVGWSRSGPDAVAAVCHWISADRTLRGIPQADRAAPLAQAALAAWAAPEELSIRLAASPPLSPRQSSDFERALSDDAAWLQEVDAVEAHLSGDPEGVRDVLEDDQARTVLLRHTARTGEWEDLADVAADAEEQAHADGTPSDLGPAGRPTECVDGRCRRCPRAGVAHPRGTRRENRPDPWKGSSGGDAATGEPMTLELGGLVGPIRAPGPDVAPGR